MKLFSVVLATHNEETNIKSCLHSVIDLADEIIVVDGDSSDQTVTIATKLGARVINTTNKANFHINKQMAMDEATGDIILQLDADEIVDQELHAFISMLKQQVVSNTLPAQPVAWYINRKNHLFNRWLSKGGQYPDPVIRLYLKGKAKLPQKDVHEQMIVDGEVATAPGHLLHYSYPTFDAYLTKFNTYTSFAAANSENPSIFKLLVVRPIHTFLSLYIRHRGYVDGMAGFVFALMSALHHPFVLLKHWELSERDRLGAKKSIE